MTLPSHEFIPLLNIGARVAPGMPVTTISSTIVRTGKLKILAFFFSIFQLALLGTFIAYVWSHKVKQQNSTIWVSISNNTLLLLSTIISRVPPIIVPFEMGIAAYSFAREWLISSSIPDDQHSKLGTLTPEQYHIALKVIGNADLGAIVAASKYVFRRSGNSRRPRWLTKSITTLFTLISLAYLIGGIDLWLHQAVLSVHLTSFSTALEPTTSFSRAINTTLCPENAIHPCTSVSSLIGSTTIINTAEGFATVANISDLNEVVLLPGTSIALMLPSQGIRKQSTYQASTFATYTTCAPVTVECGVDFQSNSYACLERPAFRGMFVENDTYGSQAMSFVGSGTTLVGQDLLDHGAQSQPLELGITTFLPPRASSFLCHRSVH
jgi:hypothetical protein